MIGPSLQWEHRCDPALRHPADGGPKSAPCPSAIRQAGPTYADANITTLPVHVPLHQTEA